MVENLQKRQKYLIAVEFVGEQDDSLENIEFVEYALEKRQIRESFQEWENQVGKK